MEHIRTQLSDDDSIAEYLSAADDDDDDDDDDDGKQPPVEQLTDHSIRTAETTPAIRNESGHPQRTAEGSNCNDKTGDNVDATGDVETSLPDSNVNGKQAAEGTDQEKDIDSLGSVAENEPVDISKGSQNNEMSDELSKPRETIDDDDDDDSVEQEDASGPLLLPEKWTWLEKGKRMWCVSGNKNRPSLKACAVTGPYVEGDQWMIKVKWDTKKKTEAVTCSRCSPLENSGETAPPKTAGAKAKKSSGRGASVTRKDPPKKKQIVGRVSLRKQFAGKNFNKKKSGSGASSRLTKNKITRRPDRISGLAKKKGNNGRTAVSASLGRRKNAPGKKRQSSDFEPGHGMRVRKLFDDGEYYFGWVTSKKSIMVENYQGEVVEHWHVVYTDGDEEDLDRDELLQWYYPTLGKEDTVSKQNEERDDDDDDDDDNDDNDDNDNNDDDHDDNDSPRNETCKWKWLKKGVHIWCTTGNKNESYTACAVSDPYLADEDSWMVNVKWDDNMWTEEVSCSRCKPIDELPCPHGTKRGQAKVSEHEETGSDNDNDIDNDAVQGDATKWAWLKKGTQIWCTAGNKNEPYSACAVGEPTEIENSWTVKIKWADNLRTEEVSCERCKPIDESLNSETPKRKLRDTDDVNSRKRPALRSRRVSSPPRHMRKEGSDPIVTPNRQHLENQDSMSDENDLDRKLPARVGRGRRLVGNKNDDGTSISGSGSDKSTSTPESQQLARSKKDLCNIPHVWPADAMEALDAVGPPYDTQKALAKLQQMRDEREWEEPGHCEPFVGMEIRKFFDDTYFCGTVISGPNEQDVDGAVCKTWHVKYEDGDEEDLERSELLACRRGRPLIPAPCRGRPFQFLELFCGRGIITQEFFQRKWKVQSIDVSPDSNATLKKSILDVNPDELDFTPDFIWASPPCRTYSRMAGNHHRSEEDLSRSEDAREHDYLLLKMAEIIRWARKKHPHLIVVIENPVGRLQKMPIMQEFVDEVGLVKVVVDYCTFGRDEQKPTHLWTNDHNLKAKLSYYKCSDLCPFGKKGQKHLVSVQNNREFDYSAIPQPLAEEVADYVNSRFYLDNLRRTKAVPPGE